MVLEYRVGDPNAVATNSTIVLFCDNENNCVAGGKYVSKRGRVHEFSVAGKIRDVARWLLENVHISFTGTRLDSEITNLIIAGLGKLETEDEVITLLCRLFNIKYVSLREALERMLRPRIEKLKSVIVKLVNEYGTGVSVSSTSTDLYSDSIDCVESIDAEVVTVDTVYIVRKSNSYVENSLIVLKRGEEIVGVGTHYRDYTVSGLSSSTSESYRILPFKPIRIVLKCSGRFCRPVEVGYHHVYREWTEERLLHPPHNIKISAVKYIVEKYLQLLDKAR